MNDSYTAESLLRTARNTLLEIGYRDDLLRANYRFADVFADDALRYIDLAAFAQDPPSYRNSCLGIAVLPTSASNVVAHYRALGAPQVISLQPDAGTVTRWKVIASGNPELQERVDATHLGNMIRAHSTEWSPNNILRAKSIAFRFEPVQLDFYDIGLIPELEGIVHQKLDRLLRDVIASCKALYSERHAVEPNYDSLFRLIFRLIAAKLLADRQHRGPWVNNDVRSVIRAVETYYFGNEQPETILQDITVQSFAWERIRQAFHFQNISVEALAYVYENTFVTPENRRKQDIHATPFEVAEYLVSRLPFEDLEPDERTVFEPFSGHAPFLIAALGRLRALPDLTLDGAERHRYLVRMLSGMEIDSFAREVARYSLILADYPNPDGWRIRLDDAFTSPEFDRYLAQANIVLCNPPFGDFSEEQRRNLPVQASNRAVEALRRVLERPPKILGFVLPRVSVNGQSYRDSTQRIKEHYDVVELIGLPKNVFRYSNIETVLVIAHGQGRLAKSWRTALIERSDYSNFKRTGTPTWEIQTVPSQANTAHQALWRTPLDTVWQKLSDLQRLGQIAEIHRGIEYNVPFNANIDRLTSDVPKVGFEPGLVNVTDGFEPYVVRSHAYLNMDPALIRRAFGLLWQKPKVIAYHHHLSVGRWTIAGAVDMSGLRCYQNFLGIWPLEGVRLEALAAVLNGPVANAFISSNRTSRHNQVRTLREVPVPIFSAAQLRSIISLVQEYISYRSQLMLEPERHEFFMPLLHDVASQIDLQVLAAYDLTPELERAVLGYFEGYERPWLPSFEYYYAATVGSDESLRQYVARETTNTLANMDRLATEIGEYWPDSLSAADAIQAARR